MCRKLAILLIWSLKGWLESGSGGCYIVTKCLRFDKIQGYAMMAPKRGGGGVVHIVSRLEFHFLVLQSDKR